MIPNIFFQYLDVGYNKIKRLNLKTLERIDGFFGMPKTKDDIPRSAPVFGIYSHLTGEKNWSLIIASFVLVEKLDILSFWDSIGIRASQFTNVQDFATCIGLWTTSIAS